MPPKPSLPSALGYLVPEFPTQTHAFFWREAQAIQAEGVRIVWLSTRRPAADACPHAFAAGARAATRYVFPPRPGSALGLLARPGRALAAVRYVLGLRETPLSGRVKLLALVPCAADLARACRAAGASHVHIHSCSDAAHLGALAHILDGLSYSLTLHGDLPVYGRDHPAKMERAALVTAVTTPLREQIEAVAPGRDARVVTMGVDVERFTPRAREDAAGPLRIVSVARLNFVKGHVHMLEAMARLTAEGLDLVYDIAGSGPYEREIREKIVELGLGDRVRLLGSIDETQVVDLLRGADIFALTSFGKGEAAPVAVMEAMACGVAVICSRIGGTGDMIVDGVDGLLTAQQDVDAIAAALGRLAREPETRARIGAAARATAVARFDYRVKARELLAAIMTAG